jgi:hypothetical protein
VEIRGVEDEEQKKMEGKGRKGKKRGSRGCCALLAFRGLEMRGRTSRGYWAWIVALLGWLRDQNSVRIC